MNNLLPAIRRIWEDRTTDTYSLKSKHTWQIKDGKFQIILNGDKDRWNELCQINGIPTDANQAIENDKLTIEWESFADSIFAADGILAKALPNYEVRTPQLHAARLWQRGMEMNDCSAIEAGTGTGKSFLYIGIPLMMGKKLIISTSNKALQGQLMNKDIPFLLSTLPGCQNKKAVLVQGRQNYICMNKVEGDGFAQLPTPELAAWYNAERAAAYQDRVNGAFIDRGNLESYPEEIELKDRQAITTDDCTGRQCPYFAECFYYQSKAARAEADIIVCNHSLLILDYLYPMAAILPPAGAIVVDEAHKLAGFVRNTVGIDFDLDGVSRNVGLFDRYANPDNQDQINAMCQLAGQFDHEINMLLKRNTLDLQIQVNADEKIDAGVELGLLMHELANEIWRNEDMPSTPMEKSEQNRANKVRRFANKIVNFSMPTPDDYVRWLTKDNGATCNLVPWNVAPIIGSMAGYSAVGFADNDHEDAPLEPDRPTFTKCTRCNRTLTADSVFVLDGQPFGPVCIQKVDVLGDADQVPLAEWLAMDHQLPEVEDESVEKKPIERNNQPPILFTSATLATPTKNRRDIVRNMDLFMSDSGLPDALQIISESPFDYQNQCLVYVPGLDKPDPKSRQWESWAIDEMEKLVRYSHGGAFLLFTSLVRMNAAYDALKHDFESLGLQVMKQGSLSKAEITKRFVADGNAVLFASQSFFEGVSIEGEALRLVVIDKMPFEAPNPLLNARQEAVKRAAIEAGQRNQKAIDWLPMEKIGIPEMATVLQQAHGRLIRNHTDMGVVALLDNRARKPWVNQYVESVMHGRWTAEDYVVEDWFHRVRNPVMLMDLEPMEQFEVVFGG